MPKFNWETNKQNMQLRPETKRKFACGYCDSKVAPTFGYFGHHNVANTYPAKTEFRCVYLCDFCEHPTYFDENDNQIKGVPFGSSVEHLPGDVEKVYDEARRCMAHSCPTAAVLLYRKILMNVAVDKGAPAKRKNSDKSLTYTEYVKYLEDNRFVPPDSKDWIEGIRDIGGMGAHEIKDISPKQAEEIAVFTEALLKYVYEYPKRGKELKASRKT